jgi:hypothetical protein
VQRSHARTVPSSRASRKSLQGDLRILRA